MEHRKKMGIYEFTKDTKVWPDWEKDGRWALLDSHYHYFVVLEVYEEYCEGFMFSTKKYSNNVLMKPSDFEPGNFPRETTYFLTVPLKKFHYMQTNPEPLGWLSETGRKHIESNARGPAKSWTDYVTDLIKDGK